jgi:hypothetical protein
MKTRTQIITIITLLALVTGFFVAMPIANAAPQHQQNHHRHLYSKFTVNPTCTLEGYNVLRNNQNGEKWYSNYIPALGHIWGEFDFSQGRHGDMPDPVATCERCGWYGYVYSWEITVVEPTCTADGYTEYARSDGWKGYTYDEGSALGHLYDEAVWDGYGWWIECERCDWAGYIGYELPTPTIVDVSLSAYVTKLPGSTNDLTITIIETYSDGSTDTITETFNIKNNAKGTYDVGSYSVNVDTSGNTNIDKCEFT